MTNAEFRQFQDLMIKKNKTEADFASLGVFYRRHASESRPQPPSGPQDKTSNIGAGV